MERNNTSLFNRLMNNQRLVAIISVLLAIIIWLSVSVTQSPVIERVVKDVTITIDESVPSKLGYEAYTEDELTVDVTVSGPRYLVGDNYLTNDDITVTAVTSYVDEPGKYSLSLRAVAKNSTAEYTIESLSTDHIDVYFDTPKTVNMTIEPQVNCDAELVASSDYFSTDPILSADSLTITGPATQVDKISHVYAVVNAVPGQKKTQVYDAELVIVDDAGTELKYLSTDVSDLTVTVPVYRTTTLPLSVTFTNLPNSYYVENPPTYVISPSTVEIGLEADKYRELTEINLGEIDFADLEDGANTFTFKASDIVDGVPLDEDISYTVTVTADLSHVDDEA